MVRSFSALLALALVLTAKLVLRADPPPEVFLTGPGIQTIKNILSRSKHSELYFMVPFLAFGLNIITFLVRLN